MCASWVDGEIGRPTFCLERTHGRSYRQYYQCRRVSLTPRALMGRVDTPAPQPLPRPSSPVLIVFSSTPILSVPPPTPYPSRIRLVNAAASGPRARRGGTHPTSTPLQPSSRSLTPARLGDCGVPREPPVNPGLLTLLFPRHKKKKRQQRGLPAFICPAAHR